MRRIGIYGGSFNPPHLGHLIVASYAKQACGLDRVLMMLSPLNPHKVDSLDLASDESRMEMLSLACREIEGVEASDFELQLPRPSYTCTTLRQLRHLYPDDEISLIVGGDNFVKFNRWRDYQEILTNHRLIVYPRPGEIIPSDEQLGLELAGDVEIEILNHAPALEISSSFIRDQIRSGHSINAYVPGEVASYIKSHNLYK